MSSLPADLPPDFAAAFARVSGKQRLEVEDLKLMVLLECAGEPFYARLADAVEDPEAKSLLLENGREETAHAQRLKRAIEILTGEPYRLPGLDENPYAEAPPLPAVDAEMLAGVRRAEFAGDLGYQRHADHEPNAEVAELLRRNGREETRHGERVARVIEILRG